MTNERRRAALAAIIAIMASACSGTAARENVLLPAMRAAWPAIKAQAEKQADAGGLVAIAGLDAALASGTEIAVAAADWPTVKALALADINARTAAGEIGAGVAASLGERVKQFDLAIASHTSRTKQ